MSDVLPLANMVLSGLSEQLMIPDLNESLVPLFASPFEIANSTDLEFVSQCFTNETQRLLCENTDTKYYFNCSFPTDFSTINVVSHFSAVEIIHISVTCVIFFLAFTGNLLVVTTAPFDVSLRSPINLFLVNLSLADILVSVICLWDNAIRSLSYNYILGPIGCKAGGFIHITCLLVSVLTLTGITIDRVYAVLLPLKARHTPPRPKLVLGVIWLISITFAAPFSALRKYTIYMWDDVPEMQCTYNKGVGIFVPGANQTCQHGTNYVKIYHVMVTVLLFFLPVMVIILAYFLIIVRLWRSSSLVEDSRVASNVHINAKKKVVRLALVVLAAFLICWTPLQVVILMSVFGGNQHIVHSNDRHMFWVYLLAYSNSALNPIIYGGFSKSYRAAMFRILRRGKKRKYSTMFHGRSRGTVSMSYPLRSENMSMRQRATSIAQGSLRKQVNNELVAEIVATNNANAIADVENTRERLIVTENVELQINIQQNSDQENKSRKKKQNAFLRSLPCATKSEKKTELLQKENVSIVETVLIGPVIDHPDSLQLKATTETSEQIDSPKSNGVH